ncbi:MAG: phosphoribosylformylglycinamidine synthase I [Candidatus Omnitrophica bacterium]|nr:phosphoribosylformylglycinamidine synthase I [Candidatus Omnitrophota bacterium]
MKKVRVCVLRTAGTNCDKETAFAFFQAGAITELVHVNSLIDRQKQLSDYQILAFPGGFSYGDDIAAGKILANELKCKLSADLKRFIGEGKLIIGICNGFQILVKAGLLPGNDDFIQESSLIINDSGKFEDRWVYLRPQAKCIWTKNLPEIIYLPVAHGEGKFVTKSKEILQGLRKNQQIVFQYCDKQGKFAGYPENPNGSVDNIAGICDKTGRVLGLMPHPERHASFYQHPKWTSVKSQANKEGDGLKMFKNGVEYARKNL